MPNWTNLDQVAPNWTKLYLTAPGCSILHQVTGGILRAHAFIHWTTIGWVHRIWRREIENSRKLVTIPLKAISLVLWVPYFPTKNAPRDKNWTFSMRVFSGRFFSSRFSWPFKDFKELTQKSLFPYKSDFYWQSNVFLWVISKLMVFLIKEEMHRSNVQLLKESEKKLLRKVYLLAPCLMLNWSRRYATKTWNLWVFFTVFREFSRKNI